MRRASGALMLALLVPAGGGAGPAAGAAEAQEAIESTLQYLPEARTCGRNQSMPGARSMWVVVMRLTPVAIEENPTMNTPAAAATTLLLE